MNMYYGRRYPVLLSLRMLALSVGNYSATDSPRSLLAPRVLGFTYVMLPPLCFSLSLAHAIFLMSDDNAASGRVSRSNDITSIAVCQSRILTDD